MKQRYIIIGSLVILLLLVGWMAADLFLSRPDNRNPYEYDLEALRKSDTSTAMYRETQTLSPAFSGVHGIAVDKSGDVFICGGDSLEILGPDLKSKRILSIPGMANCIFVDQQGNILLGMGGHLEILNSEGRLLKKFTAPSGNVVLTSIAARDRDIFAADAGNKLVYHYDYTGKLLNTIGQKDPARGIPGFIIPSPYFDLAFSPEGELWVVNPGRHQFEKYDAEGNLLDSWKKSSMDVSGFCGCCNPSNIAVLPDGSFVTAEKSIERIKILDKHGNFVCLVALPSSFNPGTKGLDLAIGKKGEILVLDPERRQLRVFTSRN